MNLGWRVLDCSQLDGRLRYERGVMKVLDREGSELITAPLSQIAIVLIGVQSSISGALIAKFGEYDIALLVCDWRQEPVAGAMPWHDHSRIGARQVAQARLSAPRAKQAWKAIVKAKIAGQSCCLSSVRGISPISERLGELVGQVKSGDRSNAEGQAARIYWPAITEDPTFRRTPQCSDRGWNMYLNYGYTLLRGHGIRAVTAAGLCGTLGIFHHHRENAFALVDDLIEPFRPLIDYHIFSSFDELCELDRDSKKIIINCFDKPFNGNGKSLVTMLEEFAHHYGAYVEDKIERLVVPRWEGRR
ncbi:type II CRISPR-associated endonuclease Cas1 [Corynebacterium choanae]|uniref:CRISPR-associated endonuclease Cas1 n=1 Tax=Corynebacterium choanae TaxID=1862358 RepID=A0A3G6J9V8_9CORY|nr:type II CRISPR-associated endonuclease Cas1 [Corynebacterium choanae]AZA12814.1 CRISPR-associated endonuclease Cas1 [Corynebacterium choanae]